MAVRFSEVVEVVTEKEKEDVDSDSDSDSSSSDFHEIVTSSSDAETVASSDEDDALLLELALGSAYGCDPSLFKNSEPSARSSLLFLDKHLLDDDSSVKEGKGDAHVCISMM